jgi:hypothetical protein
VVHRWDRYIYKGTTQFLELPPRKESITHDWRSDDGLDIDASRIFFAARDVPLECSIITTTEKDFLIKRDLLMEQFRKPGLRRLNFTSTGQRSFYVIYKDSSNWQAVEALKGSPMEGQIMYKFTITFTEPNPVVGGSYDTFLITEDGAFIII